MEINRINSASSPRGEDSDCLVEIVNRAVNAAGGIEENGELSDELDGHVILGIINEFGYKAELKCKHRNCSTVCTIAMVFGGKALVATNNRANCVKPDTLQ